MTTQEQSGEVSPNEKAPMEAWSPEFWEIYVPDGRISQEEERIATEIAVKRFFEHTDVETMGTIERFMQFAKENSAQSYLDNGDYVGLNNALRRTMNYLKIIKGGTLGMSEGYMVGKYMDKIVLEEHKERRAMLNGKSGNSIHEQEDTTES